MYTYKQFYFKQFSLVWVFFCLHTNVKTASFQAIHFSINTQFSSIWFIDRTLSGATTPGQSGPGSEGNEGLLHITQKTSITGTSPSDYLASHLGHSLEGGGLPLCRDAKSISGRADKALEINNNYIRKKKILKMISEN